MCPVSRKKTLLGNEKENLAHIRKLIKFHIWYPSDRPKRGIGSCALCNEKIDIDKREPSFYAVWCGFICERCKRRYESEIEELSNL